MAQLGLGMASLGRPGYINLGHGQERLVAMTGQTRLSFFLRSFAWIEKRMLYQQALQALLAPLLRVRR